MSGARSRISRTPTLRMARGSTTTRRMGSPWGPGFLRRRAKEHLLRWGASASGHPRLATRSAHDPNGWFCGSPFVPPGLRVELGPDPLGEGVGRERLGQERHARVEDAVVDDRGLGV